jgi:SAM-dependent methyltransferase
MTEPMSKQFWDDRYNKEVFAYGESPNNFLAKHLKAFQPGRILFPAEGEGRNAVYAASLGWDTVAFDISTAGRLKAEMLAHKTGSQLDYHIKSAIDFDYSSDSYDAVALIYAHFPRQIKDHFHQMIQQCLKPGGVIIMEAFSLLNLEYQKINPYIGGPSDPEMLYTVDEVMDAFPSCKTVFLEQVEVELHEGVYHNGTGSVIHYIGIKKEKPSE